eukprot:COSAG02_NODE_38101_length_433_cov_0.919162_1_plen_53_part_10
MRVVEFDLLCARTRSHTLTHAHTLGFAFVRTLQRVIQAHKTKFKRTVERPKTH